MSTCMVCRDIGKWMHQNEAEVIEAWAGSSKAQRVSHKYVKSRMSIVNYKVPVTIRQGRPFVIKGTVRSDAKIVRIDVGVQKKSTGNWVKNCHYRDSSVYKTSFSLSTADEYIMFRKLPAGTYVFKVRAKDINGTTKVLLRKEFKVKRVVLRSAVRPREIEKGEDFDIGGYISSYRTILRVEVGIVKKSTGSWVKGSHKVVRDVGSHYYYLKNADKYLDFDSLKRGEYYFRVKVRTSDGRLTTVSNQKFTVK